MRHARLFKSDGAFAALIRGQKFEAQASFSPLLTLNYSTTRRPGEDFIKIARIVIASGSEPTGKRKRGQKEREIERERPLKFTSLRDAIFLSPRQFFFFFFSFSSKMCKRASVTWDKSDAL